MTTDIVNYMLNSVYDDYSFMVDFYKLGRGLDTQNNIKTNELKIWKVYERNLEDLPSEFVNTFSDTETYNVKWCFEFEHDNKKIKMNLFFLWKGMQASKGVSPLPPDFENEQTIVERINQWSEPPVFFRLFKENFVVYRGNNFDNFTPHLFMMRGEFKEEMHLYEVACSYENLRSKTSFLLIEPVQKQIIYWHGQKSLKLYKQHKIHESLKHIIKDFDSYSVISVNEGDSNASFANALNGNPTDYVSNVSGKDFMPKLFFYNSITGEFMATLVEYSLSSINRQSHFPFLHSHLYSALGPATFLIDNYDEIWLWGDSKRQDTDFITMKNISIKYCQSVKKQRGLNTINLKYVVAGKEPLAFVNIFPYWIKDVDRLTEEWEEIPVDEN